MTGPDRDYITKILNDNLIYSPCLELGAGYEGQINRSLLEKAGIEYYGSDIVTGEDVDFVVDFELPVENIRQTFEQKELFGSVLVLNVLEHTFNPIQVLDNVFTILRPQGTCIIITPSVWVLHKYPIDCWRINPDFYEEYCKRRGHRILYNYFEYIGREKVLDNVYGEDRYYPTPSPNKFKTFWSRAVHKIFNTYGRSMFFPWNVACGVVIEKESSE